MNTCISFDDVTLLPQYSNISSRNEIKLDVSFAGKATINFPFFGSPLDKVTEDKSLITMIHNGCSGVIHRYLSIENQCKMVRNVFRDVNQYGFIGAAVGMTGDYLERAKELENAGANLICVDVAHGHHAMMKSALKNLNAVLGGCTLIMAGNVATFQGFRDLEEWGADLIRVGISGGSICATRMQTGHGVPTLSSILDISNYYKNSHLKKRAALIADGGIRSSGDIVISLAAGADAVMLGSLFAGHYESPGEIEVIEGKNMKCYRGGASRESQVDFKGTYNSIEGVSTHIPIKGFLKDTITDLAAGVRSGLSYSGARDIQEFQRVAKYIQVSPSSIQQLYPHIYKV